MYFKNWLNIYFYNRYTEKIVSTYANLKKYVNMQKISKKKKQQKRTQ